MQSPCLVGHMSLVDNSPSASCLAGAAPWSPPSTEDLQRHPDRGLAPGHGALRRLLLASLTRQLADANGHQTSTAATAAPRPGAWRSESAERQRSRGSGPRPGPRPPSRARHAPGRQRGRGLDVGHRHLRVAGVLNGWTMDTTGAESMKVVFTEDQKRNARSNWTSSRRSAPAETPATPSGRRGAWSSNRRLAQSFPPRTNQVKTSSSYRPRALVEALLLVVPGTSSAPAGRRRRRRPGLPFVHVVGDAGVLSPTRRSRSW